MSTFQSHALPRIATASALVLTALAALSTTGCWQGPGPEHIRRAVERDVPGARFDQEVHLRFGRLSTGLARFVANRALDPEEDREARVALNAVRRVEVAVYTNRSSLPDATLESLTMPRSLRRRLSDSGWMVMTEARDAGSTAWVLVHRDGTRARRVGGPAIRGLYVVALDAEELAVVRLEGHFDEAFARIFADDPHGAREHILADDTAEGRAP